MPRLRDLFDEIKALFHPYVQEETAVERAMAWGQIYTQVDSAVWDDGNGMWLHELYNENDGSMYAIASQEGKLFRASVTIASGAVTLGEWSQVEVQHVPVTSSITLFRQADGQYRWAGIACTAILNKVFALDSTALFDRFVERFAARDLEQSPVHMDFFHEDIFFGEVDYVARDGYSLIASGLFYDNEIGRAVVAGLEAEPDYWGQSISFNPKAPATLVDIGNDIQFPVWEDGELERIALLPRDRAAAWFTTVNTRSIDMKKSILDALKRLVGEDNAEELAGQSDEINERVADEGMIARSTEEAPLEPEAVEPTPVEQDPEPTPESTPDLSATPPDVAVIREVRAQQVEILAVLETLTLTVERLDGETRDRLAALEVSEQERRQAWVSDLPAVTTRTVVRPRVQRHDPDADEEAVSTSALIAGRLAEKGLTPGG